MPSSPWLLLVNALLVTGVLLWISLLLDLRPVLHRLREGAAWLGWRPLPNELPRLTGWALVLGLLLQRIFLPLLEGGHTLLLLSASIFLFQGIVSAIVLARLHFHRIPTSEAFGLSSLPRPSDLLWGLAGYCLALPLVVYGGILSQFLLESLGLPTQPQQVLQNLRDLRGPATWTPVFLLVAGLVPFLEELLFRGVLFTWLAQTLGPLRALLLQAFFFALIHNHASGFLGLFSLALLLGLLLLHTRRLWVCIALHALFNAASLVHLLLLPQGPLP